MGRLPRRRHPGQDPEQMDAQFPSPGVFSIPQVIRRRLCGEYGNPDCHARPTRRSGCPVPRVDRRLEFVLCDLDAPGLCYQRLLHDRLCRAYLVSQSYPRLRIRVLEKLTMFVFLAGRFSFAGLVRGFTTLVAVSFNYSSCQRAFVLMSTISAFRLCHQRRGLAHRIYGSGNKRVCRKGKSAYPKYSIQCFIADAVGRLRSQLSPLHTSFWSS